MRVISATKTEKFLEIQLELSFLCFKWEETYRKVDNSIFRFKNGSYEPHRLGHFKLWEIRDLFSIAERKLDLL